MVILVALAIPINFSILVMIIRKNKNLDMVPAIFYSGIFSVIYGLILSESFVFTSHDILMGFFLGVPQLAFGFICITIGSRSTPLQQLVFLCSPKQYVLLYGFCYF